MNNYDSQADRFYENDIFVENFLLIKGKKHSIHDVEKRIQSLDNVINKGKNEVRPFVDEWTENT